MDKMWIILDFDGVLCDSTKLYYDAHNKYAKENGIPLICNSNDFKNIIDDKRIEDIVDDVNQYYDYINTYIKQRIDSIKLYNNMKKILNKNNTIILSANSEEYIKKILDKEGVDFNKYFGKESGKNKQERLNKIMDIYHLRKENILYVGDTKMDFIFCRNSVIKMIGSNYGYSNLEELEIKTYYTELELYNHLKGVE